MMTHMQYKILPFATAAMFALIANCVQSVGAFQLQMDQPGNPLRTVQTPGPEAAAPSRQPAIDQESEPGSTAAANRPVSTLPGSIQSLLPALTGPDTFPGQEEPAVHNAEANLEIRELPAIESTAKPRKDNWVMDRQVRPTNYNETAESPMLAIDVGKVPFGGPASLKINDTVRQVAMATAVSMFGCVLFVLGAKYFRRNGTPVKTETVAAKVEQVIQLGNKSTLRLVRIGRQQVLVAADSSGIRSVTAVQPDFESMIDEDKATEPDANDFGAALAGYFQSMKNDRPSGAA